MNDLKAEGMGLRERIFKGTKERIRPIFLTASTDILGFLPMALSTSAGAEVQRPLATVVIGGLLTASILTLIVIPILYNMIEARSERRKLRKENAGMGGLSLASLLIIPLIGSFLALGQTDVQAQTQPQSSVQIPPDSISYMSMEDAVAYGLKHSRGIKSAEFELERLRLLQGTSHNIGKTDLGVQYGKYNGFENDLAFSIGQSFALPGVYKSRQEYTAANVISGEYQKQVTENDLANEIKRSWYQLAYLKEVNDLLDYQDSLYVQFVRAADLRYELEAGTLLEKVTAESRLTEVRSVITQNEADIRIYQKRLQTLLNNPVPVDISEDYVIKKELVLNLDTSIIAANPNLGYLKNFIQVREKETDMNRTLLWPEFYLAYNNQSLIGDYNIGGTEQFYGMGKRFSYFQLGVAVSIWGKPYKARTAASELGRQKAENDAQYFQTALFGEYERVAQDYLKYKSTLEYYVNDALPQADLILSSARKSFESGAIDYVEYLQGLNTGITIKNNFLNLLNQYNQSILAIEYLAGNK
jgi:cobalt-zinc-cadmium resistance protein CzcA